MTRREMLRRGAAFGGAVVWAVPAMQVVNMAGAAAGSSTSKMNGSVPGQPSSSTSNGNLP